MRTQGDLKEIGRETKRGLGNREPIYLLGKTGYFSGGLLFMNDPFRRGLLDDRYGFVQVFFGLIGRGIGYRRSHFFNCVLEPGLVTDIS